MQEWLNWHAWKACNPLKGFRGSNPRLSAKNDILGGTWNVIFISRKYTGIGGKMLPCKIKESSLWKIFNMLDIAKKSSSLLQ